MSADRSLSPAPPPAQDTTPDRGAAYYEFLLGRHLESGGEIDEAIAAYQRAARFNPGSPEIPAELAALYARQNRARDAIATAEEALRIDATDPDAHQVLGTVYADLAQNAGTGNTAKEYLNQAIGHLEQAESDRDRDRSDVRLMLGRLYLRAGDSKRAIDALAAVGGADAQGPEASLLLVQAYAGAGRTADAIGLLERMAAAEPQYYSALGDLYDRERRWPEAASAYAKASAASPQSSDLKARWATALLNSPGDGPARALDLLQDAVKANPADVRTLYLLSQAHRKAGDLAASEATARRMMTIDPGGFWGPHALAQLFEDKHEYRRVVETLEPIVSSWAARPEPVQRPDLARLFGHLGLAYQQLHESDHAVASLEQARRFSKDPMIALQLGAVFQEQKRYADAERTFREVLATDPRHAPTLNNFGYMLAERGERLDESIGYIRQALEIEPDNPSYLDSLGWAYFKWNKLDLAEDPLRRASEALPKNSVVQDHWGDLLFKLGRYREALHAWELALPGESESAVRSALESKMKAAREKAR